MKRRPALSYHALHAYCRASVTAAAVLQTMQSTRPSTAAEICVDGLAIGALAEPEPEPSTSAPAAPAREVLIRVCCSGSCKWEGAEAVLGCARTFIFTNGLVCV